MSVRVNQFSFKCAQCDVPLILLDYDMKCPNCNYQFTSLPRHETVFKDNAIRTMRHYKEQHKMYRPQAFFVDSLGDSILSSTYEFFDFLEQNKPDDDIKFFDEYISGQNFGDDEYLRKHYRDAIFDVLQIYKNEGFNKYHENKYGVYKKPNKIVTTWRSLKRWFKNVIS